MEEVCVLWRGYAMNPVHLGRMWAVVASTLFVLLVSGTAASGQILSGSWNLEVEAVQGNPEEDDFDFVTDSTFPFVQTLSVTAGSSSNDTDYDFDAAAGDAFFHNTFTHDRDGSGASGVLSSGVISFTMNANGTYTLTGDYTLAGIRGIELSVLLVDVTDPFNEITLFENAQTSVDTPDEMFVLGGTGGDDGNLLTGSLTGNLVAGNLYRLVLVAG